MGETDDRQWPPDNPQLGEMLDPFAATGYVPQWIIKVAPPRPENEDVTRDASEWVDRQTAAGMEALRRARREASIRRWHSRGRAWLAIAGIITPPQDQA